MARVAAERILQNLRKGCEIKPRRSAPLATIDQHPKMGGNVTSNRLVG